MTLETLIADAVERGVLAAMTKLTAVQPTPASEPTPEPAAEMPAAPRKPGRPKKTSTPTDTAPVRAESAPVVTETPLPPPAPAPTTVLTEDDIEADRAKLIALTGKIENGRKVATELIRTYGPKFDGLAPDIRTAILAELDAMVPA
jgi:hypothetical protein